MAYQLILFFYSFFLTIFIPPFFSFNQLLFFAPFLILTFYHCSLARVLWWGLISGFIIDLLSSETRLGNYSLNYCLTILCLYKYKYFLFEDRWSTLPVMVICFSILSTFIQAGLFFLNGETAFLSSVWVQNHFIAASLINGLYTLIFFTFVHGIVNILRHIFYKKKRRA